MRMAISAASMPVGRASISVGFVAAPPGADPQAVRAAAAEVLLQAKSRGKDRVEGGEPGAPLVRAAMDRDAELVGRIFDADVMGVVYQPVVQLSDRVTMGFEALARPQGFPPLSSVDGLFSAAKRLGRLKEVDWLCRRVALAHAPRMTGGHALFINVNAATVLHPVHPVDQTLLVLRSAGVSARRVVFELSVREDVRDLERLRSVLADYRAHHIRVAIDDVGARPSLELVTALRPDFIKVSSSLLTGRLSAGRRSALNTVIDTARSAGATLIAKGVETPQAAERAAELGFAWGQGYWLGPPASRCTARSRVRRGPLQQELPLPVHVTGHHVDRARR
jgi:EAL domain-containing protein (putative c-di-GMP-specific phosphodiesterase class I)